MTFLNANSAQILIVLFFCITYFFSVFDKLINWKETTTFYNNHFQKTFIKKNIPLVLFIILLIEIIALITLLFGLYFIVIKSNFLFAKIGLEISAFTLLLFLIGQRLAKDYQGAMNLTVYFILNIFGIYLLT
jgi:hypothetical protein